ncbi:cell cycle progression protein 1 isoform X3 [Megalops cyprinoides]|uniref:cell cycle progression protein 1 isoform X3 n=1 Tax=Megalops cyprinoides TaxID=118141 RepID=UPI001864A82C|nr:cell cycle progression protein 1 isoform X3 [Megalops cyprinoides]
MSDSSSDTESSCGWTLISNEGSDIETLGSENGAEGGSDPVESPPVLQEEVMQNEPETLCAGGDEERTEPSLEPTQQEESLEEKLAVPEVGEEVVVDEHATLCSSSDHSDIVTLEPSRVAELGPWEEQAILEEESLASEELYLGTSSSSQYTFSTPEKTLFPAEPPAGGSSSSEEEAGEQPSPAMRRRRVRKSAASPPEVEEVRPAGEGEEQQEPQEQQEPRGAPPQGHVNGTLNKCILLALVVAISMGFGHFYGKFEGTVQIQERQKMVEKMRVSELSDLRGAPQHCQSQQDVSVESKEVVQHLREDLEDKRGMVLSCTGIMDKITKENEQLRFIQAELQAQKDDLALRLKQTMEKRKEVESQQKRLVTENQQLKSSLEREEESLSTLQEELRNLRAQIRNLEERGAGADSILSENQRLKDHLEEEKQRIRSFLRQKETLMAEAQMLRRELDKERRVTDKLKEELEQLSLRRTAAAGEADPETVELQARLTELEKKLNFEQQRSDLWERLYVETKEERVKGDQQPRDKKPKDSVIGKVTETFDAMKNSTKEFVHHHKEQIKKAKEAVKENLRKFSDSVKSTFRHFKDSASRALDKSRRPQERRFQEWKEAKAERHERQQEQSREHRDKTAEGPAWQQKPHKPQHQHPRKSTADTFQADSNTRKPGAKVHKNQEAEGHRGVPKGCSGVFDCAYQESMSLFNKALDPIRVDEFNQLIHSYLQQEVNHFHHWRELESFINSFFHNGVFIHDQMLFTDFVSGVEDYLEDMDEYQLHDDDVFEDLDEYVYRHFFGDTYAKRYGPSRPFQGPVSKSKEGSQLGHQRKHQRAHHRPQREKKWSRPGRTTGRHIANVKIELGPLPFDPKY